MKNVWDLRILSDKNKKKIWDWTRVQRTLARLRTKLISSEIFKRSSTLLSHHVSFSKGSNEFKLKSAKKSSQFSIHWNFGVKISIIFITLRTHQWANEQKVSTQKVNTKVWIRKTKGEKSSNKLIARGLEC